MGRYLGGLPFSGLLLISSLAACSNSSTEKAAPDASTDHGADVGTSRPDAKSSHDAGAPDVRSGDTGTERDAAADAPPQLCDQPDPHVAYQFGPHGIYVFEFPGADFHQQFEPLPPYLLDNPVVCGGNVVLAWSQVDNGPTSDHQYDFSSIDALIAPWTAVGKKPNILVFAVGFGANTTTPAYVLSQVETATCGSTTSFPYVWTQQFIDLYEPFVAQVISHYGNDSSIGYIRVGLSIGAQSDVACVEALAPLGLTESIWEGYVSTMVAFEKSLPHTVPLMLGFGPYGNKDVSLPDWEAPVALDAGFGMGNQGLSSADISALSSGGKCNADWCGIFDKYHGAAPFYLQTEGPSSVDGGGYGSLVDILPFAVQHYTQILEIYDADLQIAYDTTNPLYATDAGAAYRTAFANAAKLLGVKPTDAGM